MDNISQYIEYRISLKLWEICSPLLLVLGTTGNLLSIIVLMQRRNRRNSFALYLTALAVSDLFVLWTGLLRQWLSFTYGIDLRTFTSFGCKLHVFLVYLSFQCSSWFLVAVTADRLIGVLFPHKIKIFCSRRNSLVVIIFITVVLLLLNTHWFYGFEINLRYSDNDTYEYTCGPETGSNFESFYQVWHWIDLMVVSLVPLMLLSVANVSIVIRLVITHRRTQVKVAPKPASSVTRRERKSQVTVMLLTVNVVFMLCSAPIAIFLLGKNSWERKLETSRDVAVLLLWWATVNMLAYFNSTVNFLLYFLSGSKFRQDVKALFCRRQGLSSETSAYRQ